MRTWKIPLLLCYISIASSSCAIITPALPIIEKTWNVSDAVVSNLISVFLIGYFLGQLVYAPIANRYGRLFALRSGLILNLIGILLCFLAVPLHIFWVLVLARGMTALGAASGLCCTFMLLNESLSPERAKHALSFAGISFTAAVGLSVYIGGLITHYFSWVDCFWVLMIYGAALLLLTVFFQETLITQQPIHPSLIYKNYAEAFKHKKLMVYSLIVSSVGLFSYTNSVAAPLIAHRVLNLSPAAYGTWFLLNTMSMVLGSFVAAYVLKKHPADKILKISLWLTLGLIIVLGVLFLVLGLHSAFCFFMITALMFFLVSFTYPAAAYIASNAIPDKASASSVMNFIAVLISALSVWILGLLPFGIFKSFVLILVLFFLAMIYLHMRIQAAK